MGTEILSNINIDLKPCPFCGNTANKNGDRYALPLVITKTKKKALWGLLEVNEYKVSCKFCGASSGNVWDDNITEEQAIQRAADKWNARGSEAVENRKITEELYKKQRAQQIGE